MARGTITIYVKWVGIDIAALARALGSEHLTDAEKCERASELLLAGRPEVIDDRGDIEVELAATREALALLGRARLGSGPSPRPPTAGRNEREIGPDYGPGNR